MSNDFPPLPPPGNPNGWQMVHTRRHPTAGPRPPLGHAGPIREESSKLLATTARILHQKRVWKTSVPPSINLRLKRLFQDIKPAGRPSTYYQDSQDFALDTTRELMQQMVCDELDRTYNTNLATLQQLDEAHRRAGEDEARQLLHGSTVTTEEIDQVFEAARPPPPVNPPVLKKTSLPRPSGEMSDSDSEDDDSDEEFGMDTTELLLPQAPLPPRAPKTPKRKQSSPSGNIPCSTKPRLASPPVPTLSTAARQLFTETLVQPINPTMTVLGTPATKKPTDTSPATTTDPGDVEPSEKSPLTPSPKTKPIDNNPSTPYTSPRCSPSRHTPPTPVSSPEIPTIPPVPVSSSTEHGTATTAKVATTVQPPSAVPSTSGTPRRSGGFRLNSEALRLPIQIVIIGDNNARHWPINDNRVININFPGLHLADLKTIVYRLFIYRPDLSAVVIAVGLNDASAPPTPTHSELAGPMYELASMDPRILFTALPEFDCATMIEGRNIVLINKLARDAFKNRFIRIEPSTNTDLDDQARSDLAYGPDTGRNIYSSVANFLNNCSFFTPLKPPLNT